jgi:hypothetical protein
MLTLKTRAGDYTLLRRADTLYIAQGMHADPLSLRVNMRVFVRAGRNLEGAIEAYQVVWGEILSPP